MRQDDLVSAHVSAGKMGINRPTPRPPPVSRKHSAQVATGTMTWNRLQAGLACGTVWDAGTGSLQTSSCALFFLLGFACELAADLAEKKDARAESKSPEPRLAGAGVRTTRFHHVGTGGDRDYCDDAGHVCGAADPERTELFQGAFGGELDPRGDSIHALAGHFQRLRVCGNDQQGRHDVPSVRAACRSDGLRGGVYQHWAGHSDRGSWL